MCNRSAKFQCDTGNRVGRGTGSSVVLARWMLVARGMPAAQPGDELSEEGAVAVCFVAFAGRRGEELADNE